MNFQKDLREITENMLNRYGLKHTTFETTEQKVLRWLNTNYKLIDPIPRKLFFSEKILNTSLTTELKEGYEYIKNKLTNGMDVNCHLSKNIFSEDKPDYLFYDWGIHHFHLSRGKDSKNSYFSKRTDQLLFAYINDENAYLIDIRPHNEDYVFAQKELLHIIHKEWNELLDRFKIKGISVEQEFNSAEDIQKLRAGGVLIMHKVGNDIYIPMGGGVTTAATSIAVRTETDRLISMTRNAEKWLSENINDIELEIKRNNPTIQGLEFKLIFNEKGFSILENESKTYFKIQY